MGLRDLPQSSRMGAALPADGAIQFLAWVLVRPPAALWAELHGRETHAKAEGEEDA
jgi:hypothetical protein